MEFDKYADNYDTGFMGKGSGRFYADLIKEIEVKDGDKEYENLRKEDPREIARFISKWAMRDALPQLSCWELMDKRERETNG